MRSETRDTHGRTLIQSLLLLQKLRERSLRPVATKSVGVRTDEVAVPLCHEESIAVDAQAVIVDQAQAAHDQTGLALGIAQQELQDRVEILIACLGRNQNLGPPSDP